MLFSLHSQQLFASAVKQFSGDLAFRYQDFVPDVGGQSGNKWWGQFDFAYDYHEPFVDHEGKFDAVLNYNDAGGFFWAIKEAQLTYMLTHSELTVGFMIIDWSQIDKVWGLGKINNRVNIDYFNPGQSGLPGIRFSQRLAKSLQVDLFASFLYIPELNPTYHIDDSAGTITSRSIWAPPPEETAEVKPGVKQKIFYHVYKPDIQDIIFQVSHGINVKYSLMENLHFSAFYLRKPENNLSNTATLEIVPPDFIPNVNVEPKLFFHKVLGGQLTYETTDKQWQLYTSYLETKPGSKPENKDVVNLAGYAFRLDKQPEKYWGSGIIYKILNGEIHLGHLTRVSEFDDSSVLAKQPRWGDVVNCSLLYNFYTDWSFNSEVFYDYSNYDRLFKVDVTYTYNHVIAMSLGANVLTSPTDGVGYWSQFRTNDSIYAQVGILF